MGKPVDCQSLLSKQELGLRVINHAPSDSNPGPYLYPKKCRWSPVPSSIKETDSSNKEAPYQISAGGSLRQPEGDVEKAFMRPGPSEAVGAPGALTLGGGNAAGHWRSQAKAVIGSFQRRWS